jgi:hypothetical protein
MLTIPQIEALRAANPHLYEALKRVVTGVNAIGTTNKLSLDTAITDGTDFARVASDALSNNAVDPTKPGVLMRGSVPPVWSTGFTYASTPSSITWSWTGLTISRRRHEHVRRERLACHQRPRRRHDVLFLSLLG